MSPRKLSDGDRQEILSLYRNTNETTSTLAIRFGVSSSTVSRFLKNSLTETEYEDLIQEKRLARTIKNEDDEEHLPSPISSPNLLTPKESFPLTKTPQEQLNLNFGDITENLNNKNDKIDDLVACKPETEIPPLLDEDNQEIIKPMEQEFQEILTDQTELEIKLQETSVDIDNEEEKKVLESLEIEEIDEEKEVLESVKVLAEMYGEDMEEEDDIDDEEEDDIDDEEAYEDEDIERKLIASSVSTQNQLQVLPLDRAIFPRVCYIVIDQYAELITKPLKDFGHLGNIPSSEFLQSTLPIFDNHKVAKRYCDAKGKLRTRKGKVIKVPDGRLLQKTSHHLKAKGISRILIDGKIYSLT